MKSQYSLRFSNEFESIRKFASNTCYPMIVVSAHDHIGTDKFHCKIDIVPES